LADDRPYLLADIGGTNTRIALGDAEGSPRNVFSIANDEVSDIRSLLAAAIQSAGGQKPRFGVIAAAGPVDGGKVRLTNRNWTLSISDLERSLGLDRLLIVNDFAAMAYAVPAFAADQLVAVGGGRARPGSNVLVCGPGTGFGVSLLVSTGEGPFAIPTEAGHMRLNGTSTEEARLFAKFAKPGGSLAIEDLLSGSGLAALHRALGGGEATTDGVIRNAQNGDGAAVKTVGWFMGVFGRVVGDLALGLDARGGVYLGGGVGRALKPFYAHSPFRQAFDDQPPFQDRMRAIPVFVIDHLAPGLVGALEIARRSFAGPPPLPRSEL
jgi:glucokinase